MRFDAVYYGLFKCNLRRIESYRHLQNYLTELYRVPSVAATVRMDHIVRGYYSIPFVNPIGITPKIPRLDFIVPA